MIFKIPTQIIDLQEKTTSVKPKSFNHPDSAGLTRLLQLLTTCSVYPSTSLFCWHGTKMQYIYIANLIKIRLGENGRQFRTSHEYELRLAFGSTPSKKWTESVSTKSCLLCHAGRAASLSNTVKHEKTVAIIFTQFLSRNGGITRDHGAPKAEQLPKA